MLFTGEESVFVSSIRLFIIFGARCVSCIFDRYGKIDRKEGEQERMWEIYVTVKWV